MRDKFINAFEFARQGLLLQGSSSVEELSRLQKECASNGQLAWRVLGRLGEDGRARLNLEISGVVQILCQRCLEAYLYEIDGQVEIVLAKSEEEADVLDKLFEESEQEIVVAKDMLNVVQLAEDEALLLMPIASEHKICDRGMSAIKEPKVSPFSILKDLKKN